MVAPNLCDQCKSHTPSVHSSPCGSSQSTPRFCTLEGKANNKNVYVKTKPSDNTCIVLGKGGGKCGGSISVEQCGSKLKLMCGGGGSGSNCIQIMGNNIIKTCNGGLQVIPCKGKGSDGKTWISMAGQHPILQLGDGSARQCGSNRCTFEAFLSCIIMHSYSYLFIY
jgi:hypothetical protein